MSVTGDDTDQVDWRTYAPLELTPILRVALAQIVTHGYDATTVRAIAREVGVTVPALYYHYENKQAILVALLDHAMNLVTRHLDAALSEVGEDPAARLGAIVEAIVLYTAQHRSLALLDYERRSLTAENLTTYVARRDRIERDLRSAVVDGCAAGTFQTPTPETTSRAILSMCHGIAGWFRLDGPHTAEETAAEYIRIALASVEPRH